VASKNLCASVIRLSMVPPGTCSSDIDTPQRYARGYATAYDTDTGADATEKIKAISTDYKYTRREYTTIRVQSAAGWGGASR
jgi:hypothetical protein